MADPIRAQQDAAAIEADLQTYVRTLTHAEALHCIDHLGGSVSYATGSALLAATVPHGVFRARVNLAGYAVQLLARRAARTRPERPGGRAAYSHDDCRCVVDLEVFLTGLQRRIAAAGQDPS